MKFNVRYKNYYLKINDDGLSLQEEKHTFNYPSGKVLLDDLEKLIGNKQVSCFGANISISTDDLFILEADNE